MTSLVRGSLTAGAHVVEWSGRSMAPGVPPGLPLSRRSRDPTVHPIAIARRAGCAKLRRFAQERLGAPKAKGDHLGRPPATTCQRFVAGARGRAASPAERFGPVAGCSPRFRSRLTRRQRVRSFSSIDPDDKLTSTLTGHAEITEPEVKGVDSTRCGDYLSPSMAVKL